MCLVLDAIWCFTWTTRAKPKSTKWTLRCVWIFVRGRFFMCCSPPLIRVSSQPWCCNKYEKIWVESWNLLFALFFTFFFRCLFCHQEKKKRGDYILTFCSVWDCKETSLVGFHLWAPRHAHVLYSNNAIFFRANQYISVVIQYKICAILNNRVHYNCPFLFLFVDPGRISSRGKGLGIFDRRGPAKSRKKKPCQPVKYVIRLFQKAYSFKY